MPPPRVAVWTGPAKDPPSAASAWLNDGQVAAPVVAATVVVVLGDEVVLGDDVVVDEGVVVENDVDVVAGPALPDPQPVRIRPIASAPSATAVRRFIA